MSWPKIARLSADVRSGKVSALALAKQSLEVIKKNSEYNALITINDKALDMAKKIDDSLKKKQPLGPLAGIPYIAKDNFLTKGLRTTAASNILADFVPPYNATAIERMEEAGAVLMAKANLDSFAHGSSTENSDYGVTLNPFDKTRVAGGSSGGSAAAVALGMAPIALGTDTGGSIRLPASFTGTVGMKPTYGLVSRYGVVAMASSTDVIGPIASNVEDAALVLDVISGRDPFDATTIERSKKPYRDLQGSLKGSRIGIIKEYQSESVQKEVAETLDKTVALLKKHGAEVKEISLANIKNALAVYYILMPAEVSSNLSRYDGIRYGFSSGQAKTIEQTYVLSRSTGFNDEVKRRIMIGTYVLSSGYYDAYYNKAQAVRTLICKEFDKAFNNIDLMLGPTSPTTAFKIGVKSDPLQMYLSDIMTVAANLVGIPAISLNGGFDRQGLPIGIQLMAQQHHDAQLLVAAHQLEEGLQS